MPFFASGKVIVDIGSLTFGNWANVTDAVNKMIARDAIFFMSCKLRAQSKKKTSKILKRFC